MIFKVEVDSQPKRFLKKAEKDLKKRLILKIEALRSNPVPNDAKRVINQKEKTFRVRVGDYRIL